VSSVYTQKTKRRYVLASTLWVPSAVAWALNAVLRIKINIIIIFDFPTYYIIVYNRILILLYANRAKTTYGLR